jgi:hypothetical protein
VWWRHGVKFIFGGQEMVSGICTLPTYFNLYQYVIASQAFPEVEPVTKLKK